MVRTAISGLPMHVSIAHFSFNIDINLIASRYCWSTAAATRKKSKIISSVTRNVGGIIRMVMGSIISVIIGSILYRIIKSSCLSRCVNWKFILLFLFLICCLFWSDCFQDDVIIKSQCMATEKADTDWYLTIVYLCRCLATQKHKVITERENNSHSRIGGNHKLTNMTWSVLVDWTDFGISCGIF